MEAAKNTSLEISNNWKDRKEHTMRLIQKNLFKLDAKHNQFMKKLDPLSYNYLSINNCSKRTKICKTKRALNEDLVEFKTPAKKKRKLVKAISKQRIPLMARTTNSRSPMITSLRKGKDESRESIQKYEKSSDNCINNTKILEACASQIIKDSQNPSCNLEKLTRNIYKNSHISKFERFLQKIRPNYIPDIQDSDLKHKYQSYDFTPKVYHKSMNHYKFNSPQMEGLIVTSTSNSKKPLQKKNKMKLSKSFDLSTTKHLKTPNRFKPKISPSNISNIYITSLHNTSFQNQRNALFRQLNHGEINLPSCPKITNKICPNNSTLYSVDHKVHSRFIGARKLMKSPCLNYARKGFKVKKIQGR
ncbi:unnamed protein product [Moneuplotes crassus]|uniref:Uncharacterized protein n=1 Tax=Euplotes crassus TaxID=5936 RepID=A0AAD1UGB0_EUPCR|nr:unnamed protein product [Moneuplotes crassus]